MEGVRHTDVTRHPKDTEGLRRLVTQQHGGDVSHGHTQHHRGGDTSRRGRVTTGHECLGTDGGDMSRQDGSLRTDGGDMSRQNTDAWGQMEGTCHNRMGP